MRALLGKLGFFVCVLILAAGICLVMFMPDAEGAGMMNVGALMNPAGGGGGSVGPPSNGIATESNLVLITEAGAYLIIE
jgi:hypothetical protein